MSITLIEMTELVREPQFINLVTALLAVTATTVLDTDDPANLEGGTLQFEYRKAFADQVNRDAEAAARKKLWIVAGFCPTTTPWTISDAALLSAILAKWDILSGYNVKQPSV